MSLPESQWGRPEPVAGSASARRSAPPTPAASRVLEFQDLSSVPPSTLNWLIEGWQLTSGHGVVGGPEKACKTWFLLMKAIAVASGKPFLGEFAVPTRRKVLYISGEGGLDLIRDRAAHACRMYGISLADLDDWLYVTDQIAPVTSGAFKDGLRAAVAAHDPGLVIVDPAYVYLPAAGNAGDVFTMGGLLANLADVVGERALDVAHHFRKMDPGAEPGLTDLSQAGFREWAGHWVLLWHNEDPDPETGSFRLGVKVGSRRGFGRTRGLNVELGAFNELTLQHEGIPSWEVVKLEKGSNADEKKFLEAIKAGPAGSNKIKERTGFGAGKVGKLSKSCEASGYLTIETDGQRKLHTITVLGLHLITPDKPWEQGDY